MTPLAVSHSDDWVPQDRSQGCLGRSSRSEEAVVVGSWLVCRLIYEVTHDLDTQLHTYRDPVETGAPPSQRTRRPNEAPVAPI